MNFDKHMKRKTNLPPSKLMDQYALRFPAGLRDKIAAAAKESGRSMNSEIIYRLEASLAQPMPDPLLPHAERMNQLAEQTKKEANRHISMIETAAEFRIKKMIEEVIEDAFTRHGKSAIEKQ